MGDSRKFGFRFCLSLALLALLTSGGVAGVVYQDGSGVITLPNGGKYRFSNMTYGTNHVHGPLGARLVSDLPDFASRFLTNKLGNHLGKLQSFHPSEPTLFIWFDPVDAKSAATNGPRFDFYARLADEHGVLGGTSAISSASPGEPFWMEFWLIPRRSSVLELAFTPYSPNQAMSEIFRVRLPNLLHARFPQWQPDTSFPAVKVAGDVEVHLDNFMTGFPIPSRTSGQVNEYRPVRPDERAQTAFNVSFKSVAQAKGSWVIHQAELSDATGNHIYEDSQMMLYYQYQNTILGTLWPDEGALRLKLELKHPAPFLSLPTRKFVAEDEGIRPEELLTFFNVPVLPSSATNILWYTNTIGGTRVIMREYLQETSGGGSGFRTTGLPKFHAESADGLDDVAVDFLEVTSPQGERLETGSKLMMMIGGINPQPPRAGDYIYIALMHPATNVPTVNVTWLVQKTRSVEFLIKPSSP